MTDDLISAERQHDKATERAADEHDSGYVPPNMDYLSITTERDPFSWSDGR